MDKLPRMDDSQFRRAKKLIHRLRRQGAPQTGPGEESENSPALPQIEGRKALRRASPVPMQFKPLREGLDGFSI